MKVTADTNVLVRAITGDDRKQSEIAQKALAGAERVAIPTVCLCELVWVLARGYGRSAQDIAGALRLLGNASNVETDRPALEAGLNMLDAGGDFADGIIAFEGRQLGGETFLSFDARAVKVLAAQGAKAKLL